MSDTFNAARDLLTMIPVKVRRVIYGALGLVLVVDAAFDMLPDDVGDGLTLGFGLLASVTALANSKPPLPPPSPPPNGDVPENFPNEFA